MLSGKTLSKTYDRTGKEFYGGEILTKCKAEAEYHWRFRETKKEVLLAENNYLTSIVAGVKNRFYFGGCHFTVFFFFPLNFSINIPLSFSIFNF